MKDFYLEYGYLSHRTHSETIATRQSHFIKVLHTGYDLFVRIIAHK